MVKGNEDRCLPALPPSPLRCASWHLHMLRSHCCPTMVRLPRCRITLLPGTSQVNASQSSAFRYAQSWTNAGYLPGENMSARGSPSAQSSSRGWIRIASCIVSIQKEARSLVSSSYTAKRCPGGPCCPSILSGGPMTDENGGVRTADPHAIGAGVQTRERRA